MTDELDFGWARVPSSAHKATSWEFGVNFHPVWWTKEKKDTNAKSIRKKSVLSAAKVSERKVFLKKIKELQLLKLVYTILEEIYFRVYIEVLLIIKVIPLGIESSVFELIFFLMTSFFGL